MRLRDHMALWRLRASKLAFALGHPLCWRALGAGVAPSIEHWSALRNLACDLVLDVGANRGQFTLLMQMQRPGVPVHAYEPLPSEARVFRDVHFRRELVALHELALGDRAGTAEIHVSGRADSSSLLPIGELQADLFSGTQEVTTRTIAVARLDDLREHWSGATRALLKIDVQGFEYTMLQGATEALARCAYVYVECSEVPLYSGQALRGEVEDFLSRRGFRRVGRFNEQFVGQKLIQADYLLQRA